MDDAAQGQTANNTSQTTADPMNPIPTLTDEIKQFDQQHPKPLAQDPPDYQQMYNQGGRFKEQLEAIAQKVSTLERSSPVEKAPQQMSEVSQRIEEEDLKEVAGYVEKIEKDFELNNPVTDDYTQAVLLKSSNPQNVEITLPLTESQVQQGLRHKVWEAITWLAAWCARQIKIHPGKVKYKQE